MVRGFSAWASDEAPEIGYASGFFLRRINVDSSCRLSMRKQQNLLCHGAESVL